MKTLKLVLALIPALASLSAIFALASLDDSARAAQFRIPIGTPNANIRTYTGGDNYPVAPASIDVGGIGFDLVPLDNSPDSLGVLQAAGPGELITINTNVPGATTVYTLANSAFGQFGVLNARIWCYGAAGSFAEFEVVQGLNIRDHFDGSYNNFAADVFPNAYGDTSQVRLDRQTFVLSSEFAADTLTVIYISTVDAGVPQGQPFFAAVTVEAIPEPASLTLLTIAALLLARTSRRRSP